MADKKIIIDALGEAREHLILNKYNEGMMLMAQITIDVIEHLTDEALIVSKGYEEDLKTLKNNGILAEDTAHNFETVIISGVQAHNGVDIPKEHAEKALEVLTNELDLIFKDETASTIVSDGIDNGQYTGEKAKFNAGSKKAGSPLFEYDESNENPYPGDFSKDMTTEGATPAFMNKGDEEDFRLKEKMRKEMLATEKKKTQRKKSKLVALIIPIVLILLIAFVVKGMFFSNAPKKQKKKLQRQLLR